MTAQDWIYHLKLLPHPEGGFFREVYRSSFPVSTVGGGTGACTSIHYLLQGADFSGFHRLAYPELWYFHDGAPLDIHCLAPNGAYTVLRLGRGLGVNLSVAVEPGVWFAAELPDKQDFALVSCAVAPAFDFAVFEMGRCVVLAQQWPQHAQLLGRLCRR